MIDYTLSVGLAQTKNRLLDDQSIDFVNQYLSLFYD